MGSSGVFEEGTGITIPINPVIPPENPLAMLFGMGGEDPLAMAEMNPDIGIGA